MTDKGGKSWLRYGCFGCLGVVLVAVVIVAGLVGLAALKARGEKIAEHELSPGIAAPGPSSVESRGIEGPGRVVLSLWQADFEISPADAGEPLHVEAAYDENSYELTEEFDPADAAGWVYEVTFRRTGGWLMTGLQQLFSGSKPRVVVYLPRGVQIDLEIDARQGGLKGNLGGLWLRSAELNLRQGGLQLGFDEPLQEPMDRLAVDFSMGGGQLTSIGNASPAVLDIVCSMGGAEIDLRGQWIQDSMIAIDTSMSGAVVRLPRDVLIEGLDRGGLTVEEGVETRPPKLTFQVTSDDRGDLQFID